MSGYRAALRRGSGRHRRRRRPPVKSAAAVTVLVTCSAFAAASLDDPPPECSKKGPGAACSGRNAQRAAGIRRTGGPDDAPRNGSDQNAVEPDVVYDRERCGNTSNRILLTLDDWPYNDPDRAVRVGAQLQSQGIRAAFFLINQFAAKYPQIVATLRQQGHWVANHSFSHAKLSSLSEQALKDEIAGGLPSNMLRPPYGDAGEREQDIAADMGYRLCNWTIDTHDWEKPGGSFTSVDAIRTNVRNATPEEKHNGVILGHLFSNFPDALPGIIGDLHDQGYHLCRNTGPVGDRVPYPLQC
ncbi:polysaccharide deacetylase family protein [Streptomyces morookaense]|uniref:Polysaccharide deacetylase family protein n=1 Tax=Streptomyces morookaense TaxID=1970 RepID=A0A7Y7B2D2_STRMO|nr:polysaccharide deacetylase family protein [Streptomyces morookaense]NVK77366.1 polysaccharide deacetylase family protein [Streptomyces morookaense]GHF21303.1 hypothetical protein GCM10010359_23420 [Streptomyces morookaense]